MGVVRRANTMRKLYRYSKRQLRGKCLNVLALVCSHVLVALIVTLVFITDDRKLNVNLKEQYGMNDGTGRDDVVYNFVV